MSVTDLVQSVLAEGNFDATQAQALAWLNTRHELMCARTRCYRRKVSTGPTVEGQQGYPLPKEVLEILEVQVGAEGEAQLGVPYGEGRHRDLAEGALGYIWLGGLFLRVGGGIYTRDENNEGSDLLALYPTPQQSGLPITVFAVCRPEALALGASEGIVVGNTVTLRFNFTNRALTEAEQETFDLTGNLPVGVGVDPHTVKLVYQLPGAPPVTVEGAGVTRHAAGSYSVPLIASAQGVLLWRGTGYDAEGKQTTSTGQLETPIVGSSGLKTPPEFNDALIAGAIATGLGRLESRPDLASSNEALFAGACNELLAQVNKRYRGPAAASIRIRGINA